MFQSILFILLFLLMLGVLITIHELGHFIAAKMFNVYVFEFAVGFGPKIFRKKFGETYYSLRALPLGGYVAMLGEEDVIPDEFVGKIKIEDENVVEVIESDVAVESDVLIVNPKRSLLKINRGKKAVIMSAGIFMNLVLGFLLFVIANGAFQQKAFISTISVAESSLASTSYGLQDGDQLTFINHQIYHKGHPDGELVQEFGRTEIDGKTYFVNYAFTSFSVLEFGGENMILINTEALDFTKTNVIQDVTRFIRTPEKDESIVVSMNFIRGEDELNKNITFKTKVDEEGDYFYEGVGFSFTLEHYYNSFGDVFKLSGRDFVNATTVVARGLKSLFTSGLDNLSGPVGIYNISTQALTELGGSYYMRLWGLISVNLALFNLLPFPPLDGWHLIVTGVEAATRREMNVKFKQIAQLIGAVLLILLTVVILAKDIFFIGALL